MSRTRRRLIWSLAAILLIGALPLLSAFAASFIADFLDCAVHEGFVQPCPVAGVDLGDLLYFMFVSGWFALFTLPAAVLLLVVWLVVAAVAAIRSRRAP